ncbi:polyhydroxyalkanoic acid system family protein [Nannocystis sp. SCPEA4]|uniref:polyhydroxyalkanoic acid system family protein n=1 Tax=Nannocystis sp. SCPEA4 TaxID=2996787 RepID=UPI00226F3D25|nr:polyhydroxyalkanoic acid system family protein [Nannocystis sp. SCPEA4]MCY1058331.1 polyhydroxyalkanoic acid system family protein [Nannocystis sp. SCPEA4]
MAQIDIRRANSLGKATARERTEALARRLETKFGIRWQWKGDDLSFNAPQGPAKGTTGTISVEDANVRVQVALPLLLRAFKGRVEDRVNEELDKLLA